MLFRSHGVLQRLVVGLVGELYGDAWVGLFAAVFTLAVLVASEIIPKSLGFRFANKAAPMLAGPLSWLIWFFWPAVKLCVMLTNAFGPKARIAVSEDDIISMALISEKTGSIHPENISPRKMISVASEKEGRAAPVLRDGPSGTHAYLGQAPLAL